MHLRVAELNDAPACPGRGCRHSLPSRMSRDCPGRLERARGARSNWSVNCCRPPPISMPVRMCWPIRRRQIAIREFLASGKWGAGAMSIAEMGAALPAQFPAPDAESAAATGGAGLPRVPDRRTGPASSSEASSTSCTALAVCPGAWDARDSFAASYDGAGIVATAGGVAVMT